MAQGNNRDLFAALCYYGQQQGHEVKEFMLGLLDSAYLARLEKDDNMGDYQTAPDAYKDLIENEPTFKEQYCVPHTKVYRKVEIYFVGKLLYTFWIHRKITGKELFSQINGVEIDYMFDHWKVFNEVGLSHACDMILKRIGK